MPARKPHRSPESMARNAAYVADYQTAHYDQIKLNVPKGRREVYKRLAESKGKSVNGMIVELVEAELNKT